MYSADSEHLGHSILEELVTADQPGSQTAGVINHELTLQCKVSWGVSQSILVFLRVVSGVRELRRLHTRSDQNNNIHHWYGEVMMHSYTCCILLCLLTALSFWNPLLCPLVLLSSYLYPSLCHLNNPHMDHASLPNVTQPNLMTDIFVDCVHGFEYCCRVYSCSSAAWARNISGEISEVPDGNNSASSYSNWLESTRKAIHPRSVRPRLEFQQENCLHNFHL